MKNPNSPPTLEPNIAAIMQWLHGQGCAVVIWTEEELRGVDADDIECGMIEWGREAIDMNAEEAQ